MTKYSKFLSTLALLLLTAEVIIAQTPRAPFGNQSGQINTTPLGGGNAPPVGVIALLLTLAAGYGIRKVMTKKPPSLRQLNPKINIL